MSRLSSVAIVLLSGALGFACATAFTQLGPRKTIKAPHARHVKAEVDCLACHESIFDATALGDPTVLPKEKKCLECHKEEKRNNNCGFCHVGEPQTYSKRSYHLVMNHAKHLEKDEDCARCHEKLPEPGQSTQSVTPPMAVCTGCHQHQAQFDAGRCDACHQDLQRWPLRPITAFSHKGDFLKRHGREASATQACATCHEQRFCADCHAQTVPTRIELKFPERVDRQFIHRADFIGRHSVEAKADPAMCQKCHSQTSCESCHTARGVSAAVEDPTRNPHPDGYGSRHGRDARNNILTCATCHDQGAQSNCVECHRTGGVGGNPHPPSWLRRHGREEIDRNATCLVCHQ